jgi:hypothetical protein
VLLARHDARGDFRVRERRRETALDLAQQLALVAFGAA